MLLRKTLTPLAIVLAVAGAAVAQAAGHATISQTSAATNTTIARETQYQFTTDGSAVLFSYRTGAVLKFSHRLSDGTVEVWAGVTKPAGRLVLVNGGYYVGGAPKRFGWTLADSGSAPSDPALTRDQLAALTKAVGFIPAANQAAGRCPGTLKVGRTDGILLVGKSIQTSSTCNGVLKIVHALLRKEIYGHPQESCVTAAGTSKGCRIDGWVCRDAGHGAAPGWMPVECTSGTARRVRFSEHSSSGA